MKVTAKKNDGVSPVIGTILLVAITVVLVAIISAVVMGMAGDVGTSHIVGVKVVQGVDDAEGGNGHSLLLTITGGDTNGLNTLYVFNGSTFVNKTTSTPEVGQPVTIIGKTGAGEMGDGLTTISVVGLFADGNQTIYTGSLYLQ